MKPWYCLLLMLVCAFGLFAKTIEVCPGCSVSSIHSAIEMAHSGDLILIKRAVYQETGIIINKPLTLRGEGTPVIDGQFDKEIMVITSDSVVIEGLEFRNPGQSHIKDLAAIRVQRTNYFTIRNNRIIDAFFGIYVEKGSHGIIENNYLSGKADNEMSSGNAIHCWYASSLSISNNEVTQYRDGIYLEFVDNSNVCNNLSENNIRYGLHFMFSNDDYYACNTFRNNGAGVAVMFSKHIAMVENRFEYNWGRSSYGLLLKEIYDAQITANVFHRNTIGIFLEGSARLEYWDNEFNGNGWAIQMNGGCLDNSFFQNSFLTNTLDIVINGRVNNNRFDGNFWSEYTGYDLDRNGYGDVPHRPVKLFSYVMGQAPESIVLLRSLFIELLNFSEKVSPIFTPENVMDTTPLMQHPS